MFEDLSIWEPTPSLQHKPNLH